MNPDEDFTPGISMPNPRLEGRAALVADVLNRADTARILYAEWMRLVYTDYSQTDTADEIAVARKQLQEAQEAYHAADHHFQLGMAELHGGVKPTG